MKKYGHILYCILDWGLGHASRSIPIMKFLQDEGYSLSIATSKALNETFLSKELHAYQFVEINSYNPTYAGGQHQVLQLIKQFPGFLAKYRKDRKTLKKFLKKNKTDLIMSDNHVVAHFKGIPSIYITHQLNVLSGDLKTPLSVITKIHRYFIKKFSVCLIPDMNHQLAGKLDENFSNINKLDIGILSRFNEPITHRSEKFVLVLLSGPEPQRTIFENIILDKSRTSDSAIVLVRGSSAELKTVLPSNVVVYNVVESAVLKKLFEDCSFVVCRSGYSSIMDLQALQLPAVLVPTPGQYEQEYLAERMRQQGWFYSCAQADFDFPAYRDLILNYKPCGFQTNIFKKILVKQLNNLIE